VVAIAWRVTANIATAATITDLVQFGNSSLLQGRRSETDESGDLPTEPAGLDFVPPSGASRLAEQVRVAKRADPLGLRHTHAGKPTMEGVPMKIIQKQLGHVSLATTNTPPIHIAPADVVQELSDRRWPLEPC
jgi:integrase